jgi:hypothetical protein
VSASDGKNYYIGANCHDGTPGVYRVDIALNQAGRSFEQQVADAQLLLPITWNDDIHLSAVSKAPFSDWVFVATESSLDVFNGVVSGWYAYQQEIIAINVITLEKRRLAHHRSQDPFSSYYSAPRVSSSWDGSLVMWGSNFNTSSPAGYADIYAIEFPLGSTAGGIPAPQNLRFK